MESTNENPEFLSVFSDNHFTSEDMNAVIEDINQSVTEGQTNPQLMSEIMTTTVVKSEEPDDNEMTTETTSAATADDTAAPEPMAEEEAEEEEPMDQFTVEAIVGKRKRANRVEYCVKWLGFGDEENTWEPVDNLHCEELIAEFEANNKKTTPKATTKRGRKPRATATATTMTPKAAAKAKGGDGWTRGLKAKRVVGVSERDGQIMYCVEWVGAEAAEEVPSVVAREKCPQLVIAFLQSKLVIQRKGPKLPLESYRPLASKQFSIFKTNQNA